MNGDLRISVIIPTYRRKSILLRALESLQRQTLADFELVVVDNAAEADLAEALAAFNGTARVAARYVAEPRLGLHHARHAGVRTSSGELLVFTDDDATFEPNWLDAYRLAFQAHPEMAAAGGPIRPAWETPPPAWLLALAGDVANWYYLSLMDAHTSFHLSPHGVFYGVNMAIRRPVLLAMGGFNPDSFGEAWLGDGESGLNHKLWDHGLQVGYVHDAAVLHHIPATRMTPAYLCRRAANQAAADLYSRFHRTMPSPLWLLAFLAQRLRSELPYWLRAARLRAHGETRRKSLLLQLRAARSRAEFQYAWRMLWSRHFRQLVRLENWLQADAGARPLS